MFLSMILLPISATVVATAKSWLIMGGAVFALVEGLKNVPFFSEVFDRFPKLAVITNAALALCASLAVCLNGPINDDAILCVMTAVGIFLTAAGFHLVKTSLAPPAK